MKFSAYTRKRHGSIEVPVVTLKQGAQTVTLVGMIHFANPEFFAKVNALLAHKKADGYRILYEDQRLPITMPESVASLFNISLMTYNLALQPSCIVPESDWVLADCLPSDTRKPLERSTAEWQGICIQASKAVAMACTRRLRRPHKAIPTSSLQVEAFVGERNAFAVTTILQYATVQPIVSIWGAAHIPGITKLLCDAGYRREKTEWLQALNVHKLQKHLREHRV